MDGHSPSGEAKVSSTNTSPERNGPPPGANTLGQEETQDSVTDTQPQGTDQTLAQIQSQSQTFPQTQGWAQPAATPSNRTPYSQSQSQSRGTTPFASAGRSSAAGTLPRGDMGGRLAYNPIPRHFNMNEPPTPGSPGPSAGASLAGGSGAGAGGAGMDIFSPSSRALRGPASVSSTWGAPPVSAGAGAALRGPQEDEIMLAHAQGLGMGDMGGMGGMDYDDLGTGLGLGANMELDEEQEAHLAETRIWGTDVNVAVCMNKFRNFLQVFTPAGETVQGGSYYQGLLAYMHRTGDMRLNLDCTHLKTFPSTRSFYQQLRQYPQELIPIMDRVVHEEYVRLFGETDGLRRVQVRTFSLEEQARMRDLDPKDIDRLLCVKGMVTRCSAVIPDLKQAYFRCVLCSNGLDVLINMGRIEEPRSCPQCQTTGSMELVHNRCLFTDKQLVRLQETPDEIPAGETPHTVTLFAFDDLVDAVRPGDRIEVTGIFRAVPHRLNPRMRSLKSIYKTYIDAIHFRRADQGADRLEAEAGAVGQVDKTTEADEGEGDNGASNAATFTPARLAEFRNFAAAGDCYDKLVRSFAPSIWEMDDVKRGLLCLLFGGTIRKGSARQRLRARQTRQRQMQMEARRRRRARELGEEGDHPQGPQGGGWGEEEEEDEGTKGVHQRGDINILLCGDPGTSKSQLLSYVHKLTPRGIYTSGKGSSAVGLTASVVRDPETRDMVLESGALVLSDNGICCIDEFDKMTDQTRAILHEAMEQQTVSITKAGIIATLNARTSILASANPVQSRYNAKLSVVDNIKLPPTLLSRFDLIYLILDKPNVDQDRKLARHLVSLYYDDAEEETTEAPPCDQRFLREYILYAREGCCPEISNEAEEVLVRNYVEMRSLGSRSAKTISATPRQLESLIRLSQALAKMRLSETVTAGDVLEATRLMKVATQTAATDPRTGTIDMDLISTGKSALDRDLVLKLADELRRYLGAPNMRGTRMTVGQIRQNLLRAEGGGGMHVSMAEVEDAVRELEGEGMVQLIPRTQTVVVRGTN